MILYLISICQFGDEFSFSGYHGNIMQQKREQGRG